MSLQLDLVLKNFNGISKKFLRCWKFQGCFKKVLRMFQGNSKGVYRMSQGVFNKVSRVFQGSFKGVRREFLLNLSVSP